MSSEWAALDDDAYRDRSPRWRALGCIGCFLFSTAVWALLWVVLPHLWRMVNR